MKTIIIAQDITTIQLNNSIQLRKIILCENKLSNINLDFLYNLEYLDLSQNNFTTLPNLNHLQNLKYLNLSFNKFKTLPDLNLLSKLEILELNRNKLIKLPLLPNLSFLSFYKNNISDIEQIKLLTNLVHLNISDNNITTLPNMENLKKICVFHYKYNNIKYIDPDITKRILLNGTIDMFYSDGQSIHNSNCQNTLKSAILHIIKKPMYNYDDLIIDIEDHHLFSSEFKEKLLTHIKSNMLFVVNDNISITFGQLLQFVWYIIKNHEHNKELEIIFYDVTSKSLCFVSWITNIVITLNTFVNYVNIILPDPNEIGNIIVKIKNKLLAKDKYNIADHKKLAYNKLIKKGIHLNIVELWISYIE